MKSHTASHVFSSVLHKETGALITGNQLDIERSASFGKLYEKKTHCALHKLSNEYMNNNPKCEKCNETIDRGKFINTETPPFLLGQYRAYLAREAHKNMELKLRKGEKA